MGMMGPGGVPLPTGMLNAEQKKKLLWGKKAEEVQAAPVSATSVQQDLLVGSFEASAHACSRAPVGQFTHAECCACR